MNINNVKTHEVVIKHATTGAEMVIDYATVLTTANAYNKTELDAMFQRETNTGVCYTISQSNANFLSANTAYVAGATGNEDNVQYKAATGLFAGTDAFAFKASTYTLKVGGANNTHSTSYNGLITGQDNTMTGSYQSALIGGSGNTIASKTNAVVLGGNNLTASYSNCAHAEIMYVASTLEGPEKKCIMVKDAGTGLYVNVYVSGGTLMVGSIS